MLLIYLLLILIMIAWTQNLLRRFGNIIMCSTDHIVLFWTLYVWLFKLWSLQLIRVIRLIIGDIGIGKVLLFITTIKYCRLVHKTCVERILLNTIAHHCIWLLRWLLAAYYLSSISLLLLNLLLLVCIILVLQILWSLLIRSYKLSLLMIHIHLMLRLLECLVSLSLYYFKWFFNVWRFFAIALLRSRYWRQLFVAAFFGVWAWVVYGYF